MEKHLIRCMFAFMLLFLAACSKEEILDKMEQIKTVGNENPQEALVMLDSLDIDIRNGNEYVKAKYDLLRIRLNDKAYNKPSSDIAIKKLITYFEHKGSPAEKQEVYYYAGSIYRDLQDTPHALGYFLKSLEYRDCDSIMLRNTYSNLHYLYYRVQNYRDAVDMACKELDICKRIGANDILPYMHLGASFYGQDSLRRSEAAYDSAFVRIVRSQNTTRYQDFLIRLLCGYSDIKIMTKANACLPFIENDPLENYDAFPCLAFAQYYEASGKPDSAAIYCKRILDDGTDLFNMHDAAGLLYRMYVRMGDAQQANHYGSIYIWLSDSLNYGKRQELAATVNNEYKYHLDQKKEQDLKDEKERYKMTMVVVVFAAQLLVGIGYIVHVRKRNKHLQKIVALSAELQRVSDSESQLREDIFQKEQDLTKSRRALEQSLGELANVKQELQLVNAELSEYGEALKVKEQLLSERMEQNKTFVKLLHQSELETKAEDVILAVRQASFGKKNMDHTDWKQLYKAVNELYPEFKDRMLKELGTFTEQQMQVCYLMRAGLSKHQIQNLTNLSRVTVWRWVKKFDWI